MSLCTRSFSFTLKCNSSRIEDNSSRILGRCLCTVFALVIAPFFIQSTSVFTSPILSGRQRDLQLYVESEPHRGLKFYHQKYNPLTPWWNERGSNPRLSGGERAPYPLSHEMVLEEGNLSFVLHQQSKRIFLSISCQSPGLTVTSGARTLAF